MFGWLRALFRDKRARRALETPSVRRGEVPLAREAPPAERTLAQALADAEERMKRLPPEKAQLVRAAMAVHKATRHAALAELSDEDRDRLRRLAERAFLGGRTSG